MAEKLWEWLRKLRGDTNVEGCDVVDDEDFNDSDSSVSTIDSEEIRQKDLLLRQSQHDRGKNLCPDPDLFIDELWFCVVVSLYCGLNLLSLALEADYSCRGYGCRPEDQLKWDVSHYVFMSFFVIELGVRMHTAGLRRYFKGEKISLSSAAKLSICGKAVNLQLQLKNVFDVFIVLLGTIDIAILIPSGNKPSLYMLTAFRFLHIGSCVDHFQDSRAIRELWLVLQALVQTIVTLVWVGIMLFFVTLVAAILVTMSVQDMASEKIGMDRAGWPFDAYWGSVLNTANSLLQFMTRDKWGDSVVGPIVARSESFIIIFVVFYIIAGMALMNAIIAVVIEGTLSTAKLKTDKDKKSHEEIENAVLESLRRLFHEADLNSDGHLSQEELRLMLRRPAIRDRLAMLQIPFVDLEMLFELFDTADMDEVGTQGLVELDRFFRGVSKLRGIAPAVDLHQLSIDIRGMMKITSDKHSLVHNANEVLAAMLDSIYATDIEVVQGPADLKDPLLVDRRRKGAKKISDDVRRPFGPAAKADLYKPWDQFPLDDGRFKSSKKKPDRQSISITGPPMLADEAKRLAQNREFTKPQEAPLQEQPPPPPLPDHLVYMKESENALKKAQKETKRANVRAKNQQVYEFD